MNLLNIDWLKSNAEFIHNFGLGFIQVKLSDELRMHFYHPTKTNPIVADEDYHNHRYDFTSKCLKGKLLHEWLGISSYFNINPYDWKGMVSIPVSRTPDSVQPEPVPVFAREEGYTEVYEGEIIEVGSNEYHKVSVSQPTITLLLRGPKVSEYAHVIKPNDGKDLICPFSNPLSVEECWKIVEDVINA
jgi:hypothetical protein